MYYASQVVRLPTKRPSFRNNVSQEQRAQVLVMRVIKSRALRSQPVYEKGTHFVLQVKISARTAYQIEAILRERPVLEQSAVKAHDLGTTRQESETIQ
jgi:hypothetical protein